jgi:hypothetical protein
MTSSTNPNATLISGHHLSYEQMGKIKIPERTKTYTPVSHQQVIDLVRERAERLLPSSFELKSEAFGVSPKFGDNFGSRMFGVLTFDDNSADMGMAIGVRNSYDQSLSVGVAFGSKVFVCDNLMFVGDVIVARKHTGDVLTHLEKKINKAMIHAPKNHEQILLDSDLMKDIPLDNSEAMMLLGLAYGKSVLKPRQLLGAKNAWVKPPQEDFEDRNLWSLYNAFTESLKTSPADDVMEAHIGAHELLIGEGLDKLRILHDQDYKRKTVSGVVL